MNTYTVGIYWTDADNNFFTKGQGCLLVTVVATDYETACHISQRMVNGLSADHYVVTDNPTVDTGTGFTV